MMHFLSAILLVMLFQANACAQKRSLVLDDVYRIKDVSEPDISPDGNWAVYTVHELHKNTNKTSTNLWLISLLTKQTKQITFTKIDTNSLPKWSPDGKWLAFLSDSDDAGTQIRLIAAQSNKEIQLTHFNGSITDYTWSPDSKEIAFVAKANKMGDASDSEAKPIVIDRYQFKDDEQGGYLTDSRSHLYLFNLLTKETNLLTPGSHDEYLPAWSPNGKYIAYVKKRGKDPDRDFRYDIFIISPHKDMSESQLTYYPGNNMDPDFESNLDWNPQSSKIAYLRTKEDKWSYYSPYQLAVVDLNTHQEQLVTSLDKWCAKPQWSADGTAIYALIEESRQTHLNKINLKTGLIQKLTHGLSQDKDFVIGQEKIVLLSTDDLHPPELFLMKFNQELKWGSLTHQNQKLLDEVKFQPAQDFEFNSFDGLKIQGLLMKPFNSVPEKKLPTFLYLHGGPVDQFTHEFDFDLQWLAANGYAVIAPNPRGSSGRGFKFARAIYADWGNVDVKDVLGAVDYMIAKGVADPLRLALGGWSYGGILTNYVIASDNRFKAALSGAGTANVLSNYGIDQYTYDYEAELGKPWTNPEVYLKLSYPFMKSNLIKTPTLFMCGQLDFNMPCEGSEQLYQALKSLNIPTQLIIYPKEHHALTVPRYMADKLQRYIDWLDLYID